MIKRWRNLFVVVFLLVLAIPAFGQEEQEEWGSDLDSLREAQDAQEDSIIYNASYIRYTTLENLKQGTFTLPLDTTLRNFQYYNPQIQPRDPSINNGSYGLATRDLLFSPSTEIGFRTGFNTMNRYLLNPDSLHYYRARAPYSELYFVGGDQVFRAEIGQNIKPNWSYGARLDAALSNGFYQNQRFNAMKPAIYTWYESPNNRYNLIGALVFNTLTGTENGSVVNDTLFSGPNEGEAEQVRLDQQREQRTQQIWKDHTLFLRQSMFIGRIDTLNRGTQQQQILPTIAMTHSLRVNRKKFKFYNNDDDQYGVFPYIDNVPQLNQDSTVLTSISNDFGYSFSLRGKSTSFVKNEVKLDLGLQHDLLFYKQGRDSISDEDINTSSSESFQNITLKAGLGYRFSDRVQLKTDFRQIVAGRNFGDYHYGATANLLYNNTVGRLVLAAYTQNQSPEYIYEAINYTYHKWDNNDLSKIKTSHLSAAYENPKFRFLAKAEYYLISNYTYFKEVDNPDHNAQLFNQIETAQAGDAINLLKFTLGKDFTFFKRWHFDNYVVYQQSDFRNILQTPELYTWHSIYYDNTLVKVINFNVGFDVRFNTPYVAPAYAINVGQYYLPYYGGVDQDGNEVKPIEFSTYPIVDVWLTATLKRTNFFLRYDYLNQGLFSQGYYTVRRYPMAPRYLRFGLSWKFYD